MWWLCTISDFHLAPIVYSTFQSHDKLNSNMYNHLHLLYVTGCGKTGLIYTKYTLVCIMAAISYSICAIQTLLVLLNSSWISAYTYDDILDTIRITEKNYYNYFKLSKSGHILHADKTDFPRPSHIYSS